VVTQTNLKTFIQECYTRCLNATSITTSAFTALAEELDNDNDDGQTVITQMAALTTQSQLTASTAAETNVSVTVAINQLAANTSNRRSDSLSLNLNKICVSP
jgi:hypothetical protein